MAHLRRLMSRRALDGMHIEEDITMKDSRLERLFHCRSGQRQMGAPCATGSATLLGLALAVTSCGDTYDSTRLREVDVPRRAQFLEESLAGPETSSQPL